MDIEFRPRKNLGFPLPHLRYNADNSPIPDRLLAVSPDQAWHLAGFGPEYIRKACLKERMFDKVIGHDWTPASEEMLEAAVSMDARAWRYRLHGWAESESQLKAWRPDHRYDRTGSHSAKATQLVDAAERLVSRVHADLWMDGELLGLED